MKNTETFCLKIVDNNQFPIYNYSVNKRQKRERGKIMDNKVLFGIMCIIFNCYGVPCFMQGKVSTGILRIVLCVVTCGVIGIINVIKGIILGIQVLKMSDEEYAEKKDTLTSGIPS